ncbi:hypothetical protein ACWEJZ_10690 [Streptomyces bacillaris]|uniref:hypothetical protein n=1 Tax=Streptomyces rhizosphaericola TaxID=2564098 RepID=UPI0039EE9162
MSPSEPKPYTLPPERAPPKTCGTVPICVTVLSGWTRKTADGSPAAEPAAVAKARTSPSSSVRKSPAETNPAGNEAGYRLLTPVAGSIRKTCAETKDPSGLNAMSP